MKNAHRMGGKMDPKWLGPYTVKERVGKGRYKLFSKTGEALKKLYSSCLLKEYFEPLSTEGIAIIILLSSCQIKLYFLHVQINLRI